MKIGITGGSGYVGSKLQAYLSTTNHNVCQLGRDDSKFGEENYISFSLKEGTNQDVLEGVDCIVHLAYDFSPSEWEQIKKINVGGSKKLFNAAEKSDTHLVQISSLSAYKGCKSDYGRAKLLIEKEAIERDFHVIRPGLVYGRQLGGIIGGLHTLAKYSPVFPIPSGGPHIHYQCHYEDLAELVVSCCIGEVKNTDEPIVAAAERSKSFKEIIDTLSRFEGKKTLFIPVPRSLPYYGLKSLETVGLDIGLRSDSVLGLVYPNSNPNFKPTRETGMKFREFNTSTLEQGLGNEI